MNAHLDRPDAVIVKRRLLPIGASVGLGRSHGA